MNKKIKIILSSYIDGEIKDTEKIKKLIDEDKKTMELYKDMLCSRIIKKLDYKSTSMPFEALVPKRRNIIQPIIITAGAVLIAFFILYPSIRNVKPIYETINDLNPYAEVLK